MLVILGPQNARCPKGIASLHPGCWIADLQRISAHQVASVADLGQGSFKHRSSIACVVQEAGDALGVVLDDKLIGITAREFGAVRFDGVDVLGGEGCGSDKE